MWISTLIRGPLRNKFKFATNRTPILSYPSLCIVAALKRGGLIIGVWIGKSKAIPLQSWTGPEASRRVRLSDFKAVFI
jgi:hypothetical protein